MYLSNPNMEAVNNNTPMCLQCAYNRHHATIELLLISTYSASIDAYRGSNQASIES